MATATAEKDTQTLQQDLEAMWSRLVELKAEAASLPGRVEAQARAGDHQEYLAALARQTAIPKETAQLEEDLLAAEGRLLQLRLDEIMYRLGPELRAEKDRVIRHAEEVKRQLDEEVAAANNRYYGLEAERQRLGAEFAQIREQLTRGRR